MKKSFRFVFAAFVMPVLITACAVGTAPLVVNTDYVQPGTIVRRGAQEFRLIGNPLQEGMELPDTVLVDAFTMEEFTFSMIRGSVAVVSIVPSIDTRICEEQTHYLGEEGDRLPESILRITVSRDTPFAQKRFAEEAKLADIRYLSDHREGSFGMDTGLLIDATRLLARGILVVDAAGLVRYMQIVSQLGELPDMEKAFDIAIRLAEQP
ncbi:MAG: redoxin family protein [Desulfobulbaceae bacterium]|nr:redoxin family protein [Desulfobulbaceae bacterium]